ncbi:hypothetical protein [Nguyenibacter vanlangensis]|uniref:Pentapeptide repeat-containing protein n=1 Tax=Nguyenibacter vanlangensis TaxID=1216886 RepID=A0A7Y7ISY8_9PROT|nr:hypothetical protein [Nguyenibacter vanlangensis]NVN09784.1 hypothetical protein [Nguyenibacter vanlangensis]
MTTVPLSNCDVQIVAQDGRLDGSTFEEVSMEKATFTSVGLNDAAFHRVSLDRSTLTAVSLVGVAISNSRYDGMTIEGIPVTELLRCFAETT